VVVRLIRVRRAVEVWMSVLLCRLVGGMRVRLRDTLARAGLRIGMGVHVRMRVVVCVRVWMRVHEVAVPVFVLVAMIVRMGVLVLVRFAGLARLERSEAVAFRVVAHRSSQAGRRVWPIIVRVADPGKCGAGDAPNPAAAA
jgi:hypothetical protein